MQKKLNFILKLLNGMMIVECWSLVPRRVSYTVRLTNGNYRGSFPSVWSAFRWAVKRSAVRKATAFNLRPFKVDKAAFIVFVKF